MTWFDRFRDSANTSAWQPPSSSQWVSRSSRRRRTKLTPLFAVAVERIKEYAEVEQEVRTPLFRPKLELTIALPGCRDRRTSPSNVLASRRRDSRREPVDPLRARTARRSSRAQLLHRSFTKGGHRRTDRLWQVVSSPSLLCCVTSLTTLPAPSPFRSSASLKPGRVGSSSTESTSLQSASEIFVRSPLCPLNELR